MVVSKEEVVAVGQMFPNDRYRRSPSYFRRQPIGSSTKLLISIIIKANRLPGAIFMVWQLALLALRDKGLVSGKSVLTDMAGVGMSDEDYVYDEASGEWMPISVHAALADMGEGNSDREIPHGEVELRDAVGNILADGDQVILIKDLPVKGAGQTLKQGTLIKSIRLTGDAQEIDCKYPGIKGLVLRAEFVRKR